MRAGPGAGLRRSTPDSIWSRARTTSIRTCPRATRSASTTSRLRGRRGSTIDTDGERRRIRIRRIHLEEDAGKNVHDASGGRSPGRPEPRRRAAGGDRLRARPALAPTRRREYLKALRDVLVYLGVNDGNMEEGCFRCDANVSVRPAGRSRATAQRVELKNINSFRFVQQAIELRDRRGRCDAARGRRQDRRRRRGCSTPSRA